MDVKKRVPLLHKKKITAYSIFQIASMLLSNEVQNLQVIEDEKILDIGKGWEASRKSKEVNGNITIN